MSDARNIEKLREQKRLGKQDIFWFKCDGCGECCKHREDILLTPYDIFRICKFLKIYFDEFIGAYCEVYIGSSSNLPVVRLRASPVCVFLMHGKCLIHEVKPTVCALYPLGRLACLNSESCEIQYFIQDVQCGTRGQENVEEDWLKNLGDNHEECVHIWHSMLNELVPLSQRTATADEEAIERIAFVVFRMLYSEYDHSGEFLPQFKERLETVKKFSELYKDTIASHQQ